MTAGETIAIDLAWWKGRREEWLRFGAPLEEILHDRRRRTLVFAPGAVLARVLWTGGDYGTTASRLEILRVPRPGEAFTTLPGVRPGAEILARVEGWTRVRRALEVIDAIEAAGFHLPAVAPDHWRHVHNRLAVGLAPRPYGSSRHRAWRLRARLSR
jgi:Protein of unknown function (DUF2840)